MDSAASDRRKRKCLVALLIKNRIKTTTQAMEMAHVFPKEIGLSDIDGAVEEARVALTPKWEKNVNKILQSSWTQESEPWVDFETMRHNIIGSKLLVYGTSCMIWSPVEIWLCMQRNDLNGHVIYLRSMLTDEDYYIRNGSGLIKAGAHPELVSNRSVTRGSLNGSKIKAIFRSDPQLVEPISPLMEEVLKHQSYE